MAIFRVFILAWHHIEIASHWNSVIGKYVFYVHLISPVKLYFCQVRFLLSSIIINVMICALLLCSSSSTVYLKQLLILTLSLSARKPRSGRTTIVLLFLRTRLTPRWSSVANPAAPRRPPLTRSTRIPTPTLAFSLFRHFLCTCFCHRFILVCLFVL